MKHTILFDQCDNHASNALPLGNGTFGCMPFYELGHLFLPMNHYEVYYTTAENNLPQERILPRAPSLPNSSLKHRAGCMNSLPSAAMRKRTAQR